MTTCELCGDTGLYSPSAVPCPKGCQEIDRNGEILLRDLEQFKDKPVGSIRIDMSDVRSILKMADLITNMRAYISDLEKREKDARAKALEGAAKVAECAFDDRGNGRSGHHSEMDWTDGYRDATRAAATAIRALQEGR